MAQEALDLKVPNCGIIIFSREIKSAENLYIFKSVEGAVCGVLTEWAC